MEHIDDLDRHLICLLREDSRRTFSEMAGEVGLSVAAVKRRIDRLYKEGVITKFTVQVDHSKLGWPVEAFTEVRFTGKTRVGEILGIANTQPEVQAVYTIAGDPDALVQMRVRDLAHLQEAIDGLRRTGAVTGTKTLMVLGHWTRD